MTITSSLFHSSFHSWIYLFLCGYFLPQISLFSKVSQSFKVSQPITIGTERVNTKRIRVTQPLHWRWMLVASPFSQTVQVKAWLRVGTIVWTLVFSLFSVSPHSRVDPSACPLLTNRTRLLIPPFYPAEPRLREPPARTSKSCPATQPPILLRRPLFRSAHSRESALGRSLGYLHSFYSFALICHFFLPRLYFKLGFRMFPFQFPFFLSC